MQSLQPLSRTLACRQAPRCLSRRAEQCFHDSAIRHSGHSRWSTIKHDKAKADAGRNKRNSIFAQELALASKLFGPDPNANPRLADLITKAKRAGFPKQSIENSILRGQGKSASGAALEPITVEAILPNNIACIIEAETEGRLRTLADIKHTIKEAGGNATPTAYLFAKKGRVVFTGKRKEGEAWGEEVTEEREKVDFETVFEAALEVGALDVEEVDEERVVVFTEPADTKSTGETLSKDLNLEIAESGIFWDAVEDTRVTVESEEEVNHLIEFVDVLEDRESGMQGVYMNIKAGESVSEGTWAELMSRVSA